MFCPICGAKLRFEEAGVCCDQCKAKETKPRDISDVDLCEACGLELPGNAAAREFGGFVCRHEDYPKPRKYPGECPCGIASVRCDYHKDA